MGYAVNDKSTQKEATYDLEDGNSKVLDKGYDALEKGKGTGKKQENLECLYQVKRHLDI